MHHHTLLTYVRTCSLGTYIIHPDLDMTWGGGGLSYSIYSTYLHLDVGRMHDGGGGGEVDFDRDKTVRRPPPPPSSLVVPHEVGSTYYIPTRL